MRKSSFFKKYHFLLGPVLFISTLLWPTNLAQESQQFLAIFLLVIWLWIFTNVPLFISGLLGVSLSTLFGLSTPKDALAPLADPIIFLFMSGFLFAKALELTNLDEYLAHRLLGHRKIQSDPKKIILAFYFIAFFSSMWISNTAAVAMLLPLSFGVLKTLKNSFGIDSDKINESLLLGLAYSATIGGNITPIGSPPNLISIGLLKNLQGIEFSFLKWILMATPLSLILFFIVYKMTIQNLPIDKELISSEIKMLRGERKLSTAQINVLALFGITIFFWLLPSMASLFLSEESRILIGLKSNFSTAIVGLFFSSLLFLFPLNKAEKILTSQHISSIDWGSLILFGTGLSLGSILFKTGLAEVFAQQLSLFSESISPLLLLLLFIFITIFFTEIASNTASANIIIPIMIAFAQKTELNTTVTAFVLAIACNSAFMLPVATPPNVIVYGTNQVSKLSMIKAGFKFNLIAFVLISIYLIIFNIL